MRRIAILVEGAFNSHYAGNTAIRLIREGNDSVVAVIDSIKAGLDVSQALGESLGQGIPIVRDISEALRYQPDTLYIAVIPIGPRFLSMPLRWQVFDAIHSGLDIMSPAIDFLINDDEISLLAEEKGVSISLDKSHKSTTVTQPDIQEELSEKVLEEAKKFIFQLSLVSYPLDDYERGSIRFHYEKARDALEAQEALSHTEEFRRLEQLTLDLDVLYALVVRGDPQQVAFQKKLEEEIKHLDSPAFLRFIYSYLEAASQDIPNGDMLRELYKRTHGTFFNQGAYSYLYDEPETRRTLFDFSNIKSVRTDDLIRGLLWHVVEEFLVGIAAKQTKETIQEELFNRLVKLNSTYGILTPAEMERLEAAIRKRQLPGVEAPGMQLWQAIKPIVSQPAGTRPLLTQERQDLLKTFLTTPKSISELARESNGLWSVAGIRKNLHTSLGRIWEDLPQEARQEYQSPKDALQAVIISPIKTEETRRKIRENERPSWKVDKPRYHTQNARKKPGEEKRKTGSGRHKKAEGEPTREFSPDHQTHLSQAATRRWQRQREMQQLDTNGNTPT